MRYALAALPLLASLASPVRGEAPEVVAAEGSVGSGGWTISVTLRHPDTGWDHYADGWRIEAADGTVLGTRELLHPHETEQPFTRTLGGLDLPEGPLYVRARGNVDGWNEARASLTR